MAVLGLIILVWVCTVVYTTVRDSNARVAERRTGIPQSE